MKNVVRLHASSGTTGKPVVAGYTKGDIEVWSEAIARIVTAGGVVKMTLYRFHLVMDCLPADLDFITVSKRLEQPLFLCQAETLRSADAYAGFWNNCASCNTIVCNVSF